MSEAAGANALDSLENGRAAVGAPLEAGPRDSIVAVRVGTAEFGLPISEVREVLRAPRIARAPFAPGPVCGAIGLRGTVVPVVDLGLLLGRGPVERPGRLVVVDTAAGEAVALLVDAVGGVLPPTAEQLRQPPPEAEASLPAGWVTGVAVEGERVVTVLALLAVLDASAVQDDRLRSHSNRGESFG